MQKNNLFAGGLLLITVVMLSFKNVSPLNDHASFTDHYSIDQLPESWKANKGLIRSIDLILPTTVKELGQSVACENCSPGYYVDILIDSPVIIRQVVKDVSDKRKGEGFHYECITTYAFKSSLAVYDASQHGISKVQVTDPLTDEFTSVKRFDIKDKAAQKDLEKYAAENPGIAGPSQQDLLDNAEKNIYKLREEVQKLIKRRL